MPAATKTPPPLFQRLEDEIVSHKLPPGTHLTEIGLAKRFGVSRTPVRDALARLADLGWVNMVKNAGAFVKEITPLEVAELFLIRQQLEGLAAARVARRWSKALSKDLKEKADTYKKHRLAGHYYKTRQANIKFHRAIVDASECGALIETVERMRLIMRCEMGRHPFEDRLGRTPQKDAVTHYDLLDALASGDPRRARKASEAHLEQVRKRIIGLLL